MPPLNHPIQRHDWDGLRVWLIGASAGIGASLAQTLASLGAKLILSARNPDALREIADHCLHRHDQSQVLVLPFDVCDKHARLGAIAEVRARLGHIDLVIFNAGTYEAARIDSLTTENAHRSITINLLAPIDATIEMLPLMLNRTDGDRPGGFAYVASVAGYRGLPRSLSYGPGKAGLISFAESLWVDLHGMGLNTWVINPGFVRTRLTAQNSFEMPALIEPDEAAQAIVAGFAKGAFEIHFPKRFTYFMKLLRLLPISWYLRLSGRLVPPLAPQAISASTTRDKDQS